MTDDEFPTILFICPNEKVESYLKKLIRRFKAENDEPEIKIQITIQLKLKEFGLEI